MQGPWGPGRLKVERHHEPPFPELEEILRRGDGRKKAVAGAAGIEPSVNALVCADPLYTTQSTPL